MTKYWPDTTRDKTGIHIIIFPISPKMGLVARKPVFGVSDKASFKLVSSATETS